MKSIYSGKDPKQEAIDWEFQSRLGFPICKVEKREGERTGSTEPRLWESDVWTTSDAHL